LKDGKKATLKLTPHREPFRSKIVLHLIAGPVRRGTRFYPPRGASTKEIELVR